MVAMKRELTTVSSTRVSAAGMRRAVSITLLYGLAGNCHDRRMTFITIYFHPSFML